jgi:hemolysin activation/secretion protein
MKSSALVSLCGLVPITVFGFGAEDASRPVPMTEHRGSDRPARDDSGGVKAGKDQILVPSLRGLAIGATADSAMTLQAKMTPGVRLTGFSDEEAAALRKIADRAIGRPVSLRSLDGLSSDLETAFRSSGKSFVKVSFPPQEITSGVIAVRVCPASAGNVLLAGKPSFGMKFSANSFRTLPGKAISGDVVMEDLEWINQNPLRRASISYSDGSAPDALDLTLHLSADKPWRAYAGIDNQLSESLGDERVFLGFQYGDLFSLDQRLTAQYTSSLDSKSMRGISGIYEIPLSVRHLLDVSLGYTESDSDNAGPIDQSGRFSRAGITYRIPLPRWKSISQEWRMGMEFRDNDYLFSDGSRNSVRFFQLVTGWKGRRSDFLGTTRVDASVIYSPGQGVLGSEDANFIALGADGAQSWIARLELERTLKLGDNATLLGRCQGQWADSALLSSDQISTGGVGRVRGFDETVGYASKGLIATIELQSRSYHTPNVGDYQAISFVDAAFLDRDHSYDVGQLASTGVGLRWRYEEKFAARVDLGIPINCPRQIDVSPMLHFSISTTW